MKRMFKARQMTMAALTSVILFGLLLPAAGCHPPVSLKTEPAKRAWTADQVVTRLGELQNVVIAENEAGRLPLQSARDIVTWISGDVLAVPKREGIVQVIGRSPDGWRSVALASWPLVRPLLANQPKLELWVDIVEGMIGLQK